MTAVALRAARDRGAIQAGLDSSAAGLSVYRNLGFETVGRSTHFLSAD
jgi:hypothetical protein